MNGWTIFNFILTPGRKKNKEKKKKKVAKKKGPGRFRDQGLSRFGPRNNSFPPPPQMFFFSTVGTPHRGQEGNLNFYIWEEELD